MPIRLLTSGGGTTTIQPTTSASSVTLTIPSVNANVVTTGDTASVTQAMLGSGLAGTGPVFSAYRGAGQNISQSTWTKVAFDNEEIDTANCFDSTTNYRFTPNVAGYYQINACIEHDWNSSSGSSADYRTGIYKNGSLYKQTSAYSSATYPTAYHGLIASLVYLNGSTDYIEIFGYNAQWTSPRFNGGSTKTWVNGYLARAA